MRALLWSLSTLILLFVGSVLSSGVYAEPSAAKEIIRSNVGKNAGASPTYSNSLSGAFITNIEGQVYFIPKKKTWFSIFGGQRYISSTVAAEEFIHLNIGVVSTLALSKDERTLYATALDGRLYAINVDSRSLRWVYPSQQLVGAETRSSPALDLDGNIYFGDSLGNFYSVKPEGESLHNPIRVPDDSEIGSSPTVSTNGKIYFGTTDGRYYKFDPVSAALTIEGELFEYDASVASTALTPFGDLLKARKNTGVYKTFGNQYETYIAASPGEEKIVPSESEPADTNEVALDVLVANNEPVGDQEFSFFTSGSKLHAISYSGVIIQTFDLSNVYPDIASQSLSSPAVAKNENGEYYVYYTTASMDLFDAGYALALKFDGSSFSVLWHYNQQKNKYRHYAAPPIIDPDGDIHFVTTEGSYAVIQGDAASPLFWGMFGGSSEHRRSLPDADRDGCPDSIDLFSGNALECFDNDGDGIGDNIDTDDDQDGLIDTWEDSFLQPVWDAEQASQAPGTGFIRKTYARNVFSAFDDKDGDGLVDLLEYQLGGDPSLNDAVDTDQDGFNDLWERHYSQLSETNKYVVGIREDLLSPSSPQHPSNDLDDDGLTNLEESLNFTNPYQADTDNDGISDKEELATGTNYYLSYESLICEDGNDDGLIDIYKTSYSLHPLMSADGNFDFDCDGYSNAYEINNGAKYALNEFDDRATMNINGLADLVTAEQFGADIGSSGSWNSWSGVDHLMVSADNKVVLLLKNQYYWAFDVQESFDKALGQSRLRGVGKFSFSWFNFAHTYDKLNGVAYYLENTSEGVVRLKSRVFNSETYQWDTRLNDPSFDISIETLTEDNRAGRPVVSGNILKGSAIIKTSPNGKYLGVAPGNGAGVLVFEVLPDGVFKFIDHVVSTLVQGTDYYEEFAISNDGHYLFINPRTSYKNIGKFTHVYKYHTDQTQKQWYGDINGQVGVPLASVQEYCYFMYNGVLDTDVFCVSGYHSFKSLRVDETNQTFRSLGTLGNYGSYFIGAVEDSNILLEGNRSWVLNASNKYELLGNYSGMSTYVTGAVDPNKEYVYYSVKSSNYPSEISIYPFARKGTGRPDRDLDGVEDGQDAFPDDPRFSSDSDGDGRPDDFTPSCDATCQAQSGFPQLDLDQDDDGDGKPDYDVNGGITDETDFFPDDPLAWQDTDRDGMPDNLVGCDLTCTEYSKYTIDTDDDNDGFDDAREVNGSWVAYDLFPKDNTEWFDTDGDGIGNNADEDDDGDGIPDIWEVQYGLNPFDLSDAEQDWDLSPRVYGGTFSTPDGLSNLEEYLKDANPYLIDTDSDGYPDNQDVFAYDDNEWADLDGDGIGDNGDSDGDGDELIDEWEDFYSELAATNGQSVFDSGTNNATSPNVENETTTLADPDGDGANNKLESEYGTNPYDPDSDGDGIDDLYEITFSKGVLVGDSVPCEYNEQTGLANRFAAYEGLNPNQPSDPDTDKDLDCDRYSNELEFQLGYNPLFNEFDDRIVFDAELGQRIERLTDSEWAIDSATKLIQLGGKYIIGSKVNSPIFAYDENTGKLQFRDLSNIDLTNVVPSPDGKGLYTISTSVVSFYKMDLTRSAPFYSQGPDSYTIPRIINSISYFPDMETNQDELPLDYQDEFIDYRPIGFDSANVHVYTNINFNNTGDLLFVSTSGESGVLVYQRDGLGGLTFSMHITDDDATDENGDYIINPDPAAVLYSEAMQGVFVSRYADGQSAIAFYQSLEKGVFGSATEINVPVSVSNIGFKVAEIHQGLKDGDLIVRSTTGSYKLLVWDETEQRLKDHGTIDTDGAWFLGVSKVNQVAQFGLSSYTRTERLVTDPETEEQELEVTYKLFHTSVDVLKNQCLFFSTLLNACTSYGDVPLDTWNGSGVMMPNGLHRYYFEKRMDQNGILGYYVDFDGPGRPDRDGDGVEDLSDDFPLDPTEWVDTDGDGIGNNADDDDDNDGLSDVWEAQNCRKETGKSTCDSDNPLFHPLKTELPGNSDYDGDGLTNIEEVNLLGTDPRKKDSDGDLVWDSWEFIIGSDPLVFDSNLDPDLDGYTNLREYQLGTPIYLNTFVDRPSSLIETYSAEDITDSGIAMPSLAEQAIIEVAEDGESVVVADVSGIHYFTKDESARLSFWQTESLGTVQSLSFKFNSSGTRLFVFYTNELGAYRRAYEVDSSNAMMNLIEEVPLEAWDGVTEKGHNEYGARYLANKAFTTSDGNFVYVQAENLGLLRYKQRADGTLEFKGYESGFENLTQGAALSLDFDQSTFYQLNTSELQIYTRDQATGEISLDRTIENPDLAGDLVEEVKILSDSELLLASPEQISSVTLSYQGASHDPQYTPGGLLEMNPDLANMRFILSPSELTALYDDGQDVSVFHQLSLSHEGVAVTPIASNLERRGNYLLVVTVDDASSRRLMVYKGAIKGSGNIDSDGDGVPDTEDALPYNPNEDKDGDGDGCGDEFEDKFKGDIDRCLDTDNDGLSNEMDDDDDDDDGLMDVFEDKYSSESVHGCELSTLSSVVSNNVNEDIDGDGLDYLAEQAAKTDPCNADTDGDTMLDGADELPLSYSLPPTITLLGDPLIEVERGLKLRDLEDEGFVDPYAKAVDLRYGTINIDRLITVKKQIISHGVQFDYSNVDFNNVGLYEAVYTITLDPVEGQTTPLTASVTRQIQVVDTLAPRIVMRDGDTLSVEAGPNYSSWPEFITYNRNIDPDFAKVFIEDKHTSDLPIETTITYRGVETHVTDWSQFAATLDVDDTANYCEEHESIPLEYNCMYINHSAIDIYGHASNIRRVVKIYPQKAPDFRLLDMPACESGDETCVSSQVEVALDNAFVARVLDKFDEEGVEIVQTWPLLSNIMAWDNVDGSLGFKVSATVIDYESNDPSTIAVLDATSYGSGHVQYRGPQSTNYYLEDKAGNRSALNKLDRYLSIGDNLAPVIRLCGKSRLFLEEGSTFNPLDYPQYENLDHQNRYKACDNGKIEFFAEDASDGYLKLCEDGQTDRCVTLTTSNGFDPDSLTLGVHTITYTAKDSSPNSPDSSVTRYIEVLPAEAPTITLLGANPLLWNQGSTYIDPGAVLQDNADGKLTLIIKDDNVNVDAAGDYVVKLSGQDDAGNVSEILERKVQVIDISSPYIKLLGNNPDYVVKQNVANGNVYNDKGATVGDNVGVVSFETLGVKDVDTSISGVYQITYRALDAAGNETIDHRDVVVGPADTQPPEITMQDNRVSYNNGVYLINHNQGQAFSPVLVEAIDDQQGDISHLVVREGTVDINVPGVYDQTIYARDLAGNRSVAFLVRVAVRDNQAPTITLHGDEHIYADLMDQLFIDPQGEATDNIDGDIDWSEVNIVIEFDDGEQITLVENVDLTQVGKYILTYSVTDSSGNSTQVNRYVYALHPQEPFLSLIGGSPVYVEQNSEFSDPGVTVFDKQDSALGKDDVEISGTVDTSTTGEYIRSYSVEDSDGNRVTVSRTFVVADRLEPLLTLIGSSELLLECGVPATDPGANAHDLVDGDISSQILVNDLLLADNTILDTATEQFIHRGYEVTDSSGNQASITRLVTVVDRMGPDIQLGEPSPITTEAGLPFSNPIPVIVDLCSQALSYTVSGTVDTNVIGIYELRYNAVDEKGISAEERVLEVSVKDTLPPDLVVNPALYIEHEQGVSYVDPGASAHDLYEGNVTNDIVVSGSVNENVAGTYELTYSITDKSGNMSPSITRTVVVADRIAPVITLNGEATIEHEQATPYVDIGATASDSFEGDVTASIVVTNTVDSTRAGVYTVTYQVSDTSGNAATPVVRTVTVVDTTAPVIALTGAAVVNVEQGTSYHEAGASASDNVDGDISASLVVGGDVVDPNVAGTYVVSYNVTDAAGNAAVQVTRSVIVADTIAPVITLNGLASIHHEQATPYIDIGATASDSFEGDVSASIVVTNTVDSQVRGVYTVTYQVSDAAGNAATPVVRTVTVMDTTAPVIALTGAAVVNVEQGISYLEAGATASDSVDGDISASLVVGGDIVDPNVAGTYVVTYNVTDASGNAAAQVTRSVIVADTVAPVIALNGQATINHEQATPYNDAGATASDSFEGDVTASMVVTNTVDSQVRGVYTVTYHVSDAAGNAATPVVRTVTVVDTTAPVISLTGAAVVNVEQGTSYHEAGATPRDNVDGDISASLVVGGDVVDPNVAGTYVVTYNVTDASGNAAAQVTRSVIVADTIAPVITLNGLAAINHEQATPYVDIGATASDSFEGDVTASMVVTNTVDSHVRGVYTVTYHVSDAAGNAATPVVRTVAVVDTTAPVISLTGAAVVNVEQGTSYIEAGATAIDSVDGNISASIVVGGDMVNPNVAGTYVVSYNVNDTTGNAAVAVARIVTVLDSTAPTITLNGAAVVNVEQGTNYIEAGAKATDIVDGDISGRIAVGGAAVNPNLAGTYVVTYNVSDMAGNAAVQVTRTVIVADTTVPIISLIGAATVTHEQGTAYADLGAAANDNIDGDINTSVVVTGSVNSDMSGTYVLSYNVSDSAGNAAITVTRTVNVIVSSKTYTSSPALEVGAESVSTELHISDDIIINDLNIFIDMPHAWVGDVIATLISPAGTSVKIIDQPGKPSVDSNWGCSSNDFDVTLNDEASVNVENSCSNSVGVSGTLIPNNPLSAFDGEPTFGIWILRIQDAYPQADHGTLNTWRLEVNSE